MMIAEGIRANKCCGWARANQHGKKRPLRLAPERLEANVLDD